MRKNASFKTIDMLWESKREYVIGFMLRSVIYLKSLIMEKQLGGLMIPHL